MSRDIFAIIPSTLFKYLPSYPTFLELDQEFGISEGCAYRLFTKNNKALIQILKLPKLNSLKKLGNLVIDVTEHKNWAT